jgi:hypothetical protein
VVEEGLLVRPEAFDRGEGDEEEDSLGSMAGRRVRRLAGALPLATPVAELGVSPMAAVRMESRREESRIKRRGNCLDT